MTMSKKQRENLAGKLAAACSIVQEVKDELAIEAPTSAVNTQDALTTVTSGSVQLRQALRSVSYIGWTGNTDHLE